MNAAKVREVMRVYRLRLWELKIPEQKILPKKLIGLWRALFFRGWVLAHCQAMLAEMEQFVSEERIGKAFRWLGFIQGVFWVLGVYTLEELKNHNRPSTDSTLST